MTVTLPYSTYVEFMILQASFVVMSLVIAWFVGRAIFKRRVNISDYCPKCGGSAFHRVHRTLLDRILGIELPWRRYRCNNPFCSWSGMREPMAHSYHGPDA